MWEVSHLEKMVGVECVWGWSGGGGSLGAEAEN